MTWWSHPTSELLAYDEGRLPLERSARIAAHLARCARCRTEHERVRRARAELAEIRLDERMPTSGAESLRRALLDHSTRRETARRRMWIPLAATATLAAAVVWQVGRPWFTVTASASATPFEITARGIHDRAERGALPLQQATSSSGAIRAWLRAQGAPQANLAAERPRDEEPVFTPIGATVVTEQDARLSVVRYRIGDRTVTLVVAGDRDVTGAPGSWPLSKRIEHRRDGRTLSLSWTTGGQSYVLVSDPPDAGLAACRLCHADDRFRRAVQCARVR